MKKRFESTACWLVIFGLVAHFGLVGGALIVAIVCVVLWLWETA